MRRLLIALLILLAPCSVFAGTAQVRAMMGMWGAASAPTTYCSSNPGYIFCDDFSDGDIAGWTNVGGGTAAIDSSTGIYAMKITAGATVADVQKSQSFSGATLYYLEAKLFLPCVDGFNANLRLQVGGASDILYEGAPGTCGEWTTVSGSYTTDVATSVFRALDRYNITGRSILIRDIRVYQ